MTVKLISHSQVPKEGFIGVDDAQDLIAYCARVSNPSNQLNRDTAEKLVGYLIKHKHWSPLEMVSACLEIETTRDIGRQILRHRSFSFQEFSQRYADPTKDLDFVTREARLQDEKNRQNSVEIDDPKLQEEWDTLQEMVIEDARSDGHSEIQLEVRGDNQFAIEFYRRRGLEIVSTLKGYYNAGIGYVMRGTI